MHLFSHCCNDYHTQCLSQLIHTCSISSFSFNSVCTAEEFTLFFQESPNEKVKGCQVWITCHTTPSNTRDLTNALLHLCSEVEHTSVLQKVNISLASHGPVNCSTFIYADSNSEMFILLQLLGFVKISDAYCGC